MHSVASGDYGPTKAVTSGPKHMPFLRSLVSPVAGVAIPQGGMTLLTELFAPPSMPCKRCVQGADPNAFTEALHPEAHNHLSLDSRELLASIRGHARFGAKRAGACDRV